MRKKIIYLLLLTTVCIGSAFSQTAKSGKTIVKDTMLFYVHEVGKGETVYGLSRVYQVSTDVIFTYNPTAKQGLKTGEIVYVPVSMQKVETYIVQQGETLYTIARKKGVKVNELLNLNPFLSETLAVGQEIVTPLQQKPIIVEEVSTDLISNSPKGRQRKTSPTEDKKTTSSVEEKKTGTTPDTLFHIVEKGETLYRISRKYGIKEETILNANPHLTETLAVGQRIYIPDTSKIRGTETTTSTPPPHSFVDTTSPRKQGVIKNEYTVFVLIPLYLSQMDNIDPLKIKNLSDYAKVQSFTFIQFYEALLLAVDAVSAKYPQIKIHLYVEDVSSSEDVTNLLKSGKLNDADLVIGPFHGKEFMLLCKSLPNKDCIVVNPFSNALSPLPVYTCKAATSESYKAEMFARYMLDKYPQANIIFGSYQSEQENKMISSYRSAMQKIFSQANATVNMQDVNLKNSGIAAITPAMSNKKENFLIVFFEGEVTITNFVRNLNGAKHENLTLLIPEQWLKHDNIETEYLMALKIHYITQYFVDYGNPDVIRFIDAFRNQYDIEPTLDLYAFQGYDFTRYFLEKLCKTGTAFQSFDENVNLLSTQFRFVPSPIASQCMENSFVYIVKLKDYKYTNAFSDNPSTEPKNNRK